MTSQDARLCETINFNFKNIQDVLTIIENESVLVNKIQYMEQAVTNFLLTIPDADLDSKLFTILMPQTKGILEKIFEKAIEVVDESEGEEICPQTLKLLQEYLQMVIMILDILKEILNLISRKNTISFSNVCSLPAYIAEILYVTFLHCKESNNIYKNYFESLNQILVIFKRAQDIHSKLLNVLENCLSYNKCEAEILLLCTVLDNLTEVGDVLSGMNVKSMADNWKTYMNLTQRFADELDKCLNIQRPLLFFTSEIVKSLHNILESNLSDSKTITHTLKISNFILRVMIKLCDTFSSKIATHMEIFWNFFIDFYSVYSPAKKNKQFSESTVDLLRSLVCNGLEQLLIKLIEHKEFYDVGVLSSINTNTDSSLGFVLVSNVVLQKLVSNEGFSIAEINICGYMDIIFTAMKTCYILFMKEDKLYEELSSSIVHLAFVCTNEQFSNIELFLFKNLLTTSVWNSLFAFDVWCTICRICSTKYTFDTLCWIVERFDGIFKTHYTFRPQFVILSNFVAELYQILGNNYKLQFLKKYQLNTNIHLWKHIGLKHFPNGSLIQIENLLTDLCEKMEKFDAVVCTYDEYLNMLDIMNIFASMPFDEVYFDLKRLNSLLEKLWEFDASNKLLLESKIFRLYLESMFRLTRNLMWRLNNKQLIQILSQLKQMTDCDRSLKPQLLPLIRSILNRSSDFSEEQHDILLLISELFVTLLIDENVLIKVRALELIQDASSNTIWNEIPGNMVGKRPHLKRLISNFQSKKLTNNINTLKTYMILEKVEFRHECLENLQLEPALKRKKVSVSMENVPLEVPITKTIPENKEATRLIQKIRKDVQYLGRLVGRVDLTDQNTKDIDFILKELQNYC